MSDDTLIFSRSKWRSKEGVTERARTIPPKRIVITTRQTRVVDVTTTDPCTGEKTVNEVHLLGDLCED